MKTLLIVLLAAGAMAFSSGCATPGYSGGVPTIKFPRQKATGENANRVLRAWGYENRQLADDINWVLMMDEPSRLTRWNVR